MTSDYEKSYLIADCDRKQKIFCQQWTVFLGLLIVVSGITKTALTYLIESVI